jgi:hypothetical protein
MEPMGRYIYGVMDGSDMERFPLDGVVRLASPTREAEDPVEDAAGCEQAYTISSGGIRAVVTDGAMLDYATMPKDSLARLLIRHQQVIEKVMPGHTILPLRLGTCAESDEQVQRILALGYGTIKEALQKAQGRVEVDVTATINDFSTFLRRVSGVPEVEQLKQSFLRVHGRPTLQDQMKVGMIIEQHAKREKQQMSEQIHAAFNGLAEGVKAHDLMDDRMMLNSAFLIRTDQQEDFDRRLDDLNARFADQLDFRRIGPLPPYSFYTLEVRVTDFQEIDWARRQLGLCDDVITVDAIKKAHRGLALTCHPDKNPDVPGIEKKFADMSRAYKMLLDFSRAYGQAENEEGFRLDERTFEKDAILVTTLG